MSLLRTFAVSETFLCRILMFFRMKSLVFQCRSISSLFFSRRNSRWVIVGASEAVLAVAIVEVVAAVAAAAEALAAVVAVAIATAVAAAGAVAAVVDEAVAVVGVVEDEGAKKATRTGCRSPNWADWSRKAR